MKERSTLHLVNFKNLQIQTLTWHGEGDKYYLKCYMDEDGEIRLIGYDLLKKANGMRRQVIFQAVL